MGTVQDRLPGVTEGHVNRGSGLCFRQAAIPCISNQTAIVNAQAIGHPTGLFVPMTSLTLAGDTIPFGATPVVQIVQSAPATCIVQFLVRGIDLFGQLVEELTPQVTIAAKTNNFIYLSKVFWKVTQVRYSSVVLDSDTSTVSVGTRFDFTRTIDAANEHIAGNNLGIPIPIWMRYTPFGPSQAALRTKQRNRRQGLYPMPELKASQVGTFSGVPLAGETVTIDGIPYTWRATVSTIVLEVLIGANATECAQNLFYALNAEPLQAGIKYGSLTTAHPTVRPLVLPSSGVLTINARFPGALYNQVVLSEASTNFAWTANNLTNGQSAIGEVGGIHIHNITDGVLQNLSMRQYDIGVSEIGWDGALEKLSFTDRSALTAWAVTDNVIVYLDSLRSADGNM